MSTRDVCDRCLKVNVDPNTNFASMLLSVNPREYDHGDSGVSEPGLSLDMSLCPECERQVVKIAMERIVLTDTPNDVKQGTYFGATEKPKQKRTRKTPSKSDIKNVPFVPDSHEPSEFQKAQERAQEDVAKLDASFDRPIPEPLTIIEGETLDALPDDDPTDLGAIESSAFAELDGGE